jgi:hypothetical protein
MNQILVKNPESNNPTHSATIPVVKPTPSKIILNPQISRLAGNDIDDISLKEFVLRETKLIERRIRLRKIILFS